jgi:hypothetical protein
MGNEVYNWQVQIHHPGQLLIVGMVICLLGMILTSAIMAAIGNFFYYTPAVEMNRVTDADLPVLQKRFSILAMELPGKKFQDIVQGMDKKSREDLVWQLKIDYYFMPFAYGFLLLAGSFVHWTYASRGLNFDSLFLLVWLPLVAWLFDIIENKLIAASLNNFTGSGKAGILIFSSAKWFIALGCLVACVVYYFLA